MSNRHVWLRLVTTISLVLILGVSMSAYGFGGDSWKEEVLLHDGSALIVSRSQSYGGRHEIGQAVPIAEHKISFTVPGTHETVIWKTERDPQTNQAILILLALDVIRGVPYIATHPAGSIAYKQWGSPNPPYIFFKYDGRGWQRIATEEVPAEFKNINVVINTLAHGKQFSSQGLVSAAMVKKLNSSLTQEEYKTIVRTPLEHWKPRPEHKGPKAPHPITPPATTNGTK